MKNDLNKYFEAARKSEPVLKIDEARSIIESAGLPHANGPASNLFFQTSQFNLIMYSSIIITGLAAWLLYAPPQQPRVNKTGVAISMPAKNKAETISSQFFSGNNENYTPGKNLSKMLVDTIKRYDSISYFSNSDNAITMLDTPIYVKKFINGKGVERDSVRFLNVRTDNPRKIDSLVKSFVQRYISPDKSTRNVYMIDPGVKCSSSITINASYSTKNDTSQKEVYNTYYNLRRRDLKNGEADDIEIKNGVINSGQPKEITIRNGDKIETILIPANHKNSVKPLIIPDELEYFSNSHHALPDKTSKLRVYDTAITSALLFGQGINKFLHITTDNPSKLDSFVKAYIKFYTDAVLTYKETKQIPEVDFKGVSSAISNINYRNLPHIYCSANNHNGKTSDTIQMRHGIIYMEHFEQVADKDGRKKDSLFVDKIFTGKGLNADTVTTVYLNVHKDSAVRANRSVMQSYQMERESNKDVRIINIESTTAGKSNNSTTRKTEKPLIQGVKFIELEDATLNKLGIIRGEYTVYYYGESDSGRRRSSEISIGNNVIPPNGAKVPSYNEMKSKLTSLKRDFFPVFVSDMSGIKMLTFNLLNPDFVDKDYLIRHSNTMVPIMVKIAPKTENYHWENVVFWFEPTDNFFNQLPSEVGNELRKEYAHLNSDKPNNTEVSSCKYFEACRANNGAINSVLTYPNPASLDLNVTVNLLDTRAIKIELLDISGRPVKEFAPSKLTESGSHTYSFPLDNISKGVYLLLVESGQGEQSVQRIVVR